VRVRPDKCVRRSSATRQRANVHLSGSLFVPAYALESFNSEPTSFNQPNQTREQKQP
jgi:hypothetical protein